MGLRSEVSSRGIAIDERAVDRLIAYRDFLLDWNQRVNLTALKDPALVEQVLILDALQMLPDLDRIVEETGLRRPSLIDIGSGGGTPAIPLAICRPALDITMVEATGKKVKFLDAVIAGLSLGNARAVAARAEEFARDPGERERYDIATARAVSSLPALVELTMPLLRVGGTGIFPKGLEIGAELAAGKIAGEQVGAEILISDRLPGSETRLVVIRKTVPTPNQFPRRSGLPARQPLGLKMLDQRT